MAKGHCEGRQEERRVTRQPVQFGQVGEHQEYQNSQAQRFQDVIESQSVSISCIRSILF